MKPTKKTQRIVVVSIIYIITFFTLDIISIVYNSHFWAIALLISTMLVIVGISFVLLKDSKNLSIHNLRKDSLVKIHHIPESFPKDHKGTFLVDVVWNNNEFDSITLYLNSNDFENKQRPIKNVFYRYNNMKLRLVNKPIN